MSGNTFHVVDYIVFLATLIISLGIGLYFAFKSRQGSTGEYNTRGPLLLNVNVNVSVNVNAASTLTLQMNLWLKPILD